MIKPTIGRVVLVQRELEQTQAQPALITYVHSDSCINVAGFDNYGIPFIENSIQLVQEDTGFQGIRYAYWMPYQKKVAAEQAERDAHVPQQGTRE